MRVKFFQKDNDREACHAAKMAIDSYFLEKSSGVGQPNIASWGAIDGIPINKKAGFPTMKGWEAVIHRLLYNFVDLRTELLNTVLQMAIEYNGYQPLSIGGSFFFRLSDGIFFQVDFKESLDNSCADPLEILQFREPRDFTLSRVLMVGQRKLTVEDIMYNHMAGCLVKALQKQQNFYSWGKNTLAGSELCSELPLRAARLELAMAEEGFQFSHGTLGSTLRHLAEQYLT